ncbi:TonB-dependent siderophore receptor [Paraglaciecola polaris]|uniref:Iron complex outermembrane recepter protein n=1 Tax=Paraglaciecola polaris LMG 21857 TaxID=1129793 RepID=K6YEF5_9ALTE|nr:TonB-dependent siderophore receptor [Paraglaciecola polaris]GAC31129.1 iron complex outermembrane recepter protein [Paraglaciecola polaris LMG 21857]
MTNHRFSYFTLFTLFTLFSNIALAQTTDNNDSKAIEKIEVTGSYIDGYGAHSASGASRLDLDIFDIPQSVSVITSAQMQDFQLNDINDALDSATGVNVQRIETDRTYYTARGFDITNFQIDGIGLPLTSGNNHADEDTAIYERVEVIRGANGLMTGVGNPSATINFIRKRPTAETQAKVNATVGSWNNHRIDADVSTPITDNIAARVVAVKQEQDSYLDRYEQDKTLVYGFVEANLTDSTKLSFSHSYLDNKAKGNNWGALPLFYTDGSATNYDTSTNTSADWSNWTVIKNNTVIELSHYFNDNWSLRSTYSHKTTDEDTELFYVFGTPDKETELGLTGYGSEYDLDDEHNLFDVYVSGDFSLFNRDHQVVFGLNYAKMSYTDSSLYDYTTGNGFPPITNLNTWNGNTPKPTFADALTGSDVQTKQKAAYFTGRFNVADGLHIIAGGRFNEWQAQGTSYGVLQDVNNDEFIPYLGAVYEFMPNTVAYASYTETFVSQTQVDINDNILAPITGESREIGVKRQWLNDSLITSLAYFDIEQVNVAIIDPATADFPIAAQRYIGADGINSNGFELDIAGQLTDGLQVSFGYTDFDIDGDETVKAYTPSQLLKLGATYQFQQWDQFSVGINMRWQNKTSRDQGVVGEGFTNAGDTITTTQDAYSVVDLMARYQFNDAITLTVNVNNATDEKYINSLYWAQGFYGAPVNYNATLSWKL